MDNFFIFSMIKTSKWFNLILGLNLTLFTRPKRVIQVQNFVPVKTGLAAFGMSGKVFHAPLLQAHPGFELKSIVERKYRGAREHYPNVHVAHRFEELLADDSLEMIVVNTPEMTHYDLAKLVLEAGKHVIIEKPFTVYPEEAEELMTLAKSKGLILSVFQNRRWDGDFMTVQKVLSADLLGRIVSYEAHFDRYKEEIKEGTWKEERVTSAEIMYNLGAHLIDQVFQLFGKPGTVWADIGIQRTGGLVDDFYHLVLGYPRLHITLKSSYQVREPGPKYIMHGTLGSFLKWGMDPQEDQLKMGKNPQEDDFGLEGKKFWGKLNTSLGDMHFTGRIETEQGNYLAYYDNIARVIRNGEELIVKPEQSLDVIRIIRAAIESNEKGVRVEL